MDHLVSSFHGALGPSVYVPLYPPPERQASNPARWLLATSVQPKHNGEKLTRIPLPYGWERVEALTHEKTPEPHQAAAAIERVDEAVDKYDDVHGVSAGDVRHDLRLLCRDRNTLSLKLHDWNKVHDKPRRMHEYERRLLRFEHPNVIPPEHLVAVHPHGALGSWGVVTRHLVPFEAHS